MQDAAMIGRRSEEAKRVGARIKALLATLLFTTAFAAGCGGSNEAQDNSTTQQDTRGQTIEQTKGARERTEDTETGRERTGSRGSSQETTLSIEGDPGTEFSGVCNVGDEENEISGQVPESFDYDLGREQLQCEIRQENTGSLDILLTGPGNRIEQHTNTPEGTASLAYSGGGVSSSTSSSGSSNSVNQVVSNSSSRSSSSSSSVVSR